MTAIAQLLADAGIEVKPLEWFDCADETSHDAGCQYEIEPMGNYFRLTRASTGPGGYIGHSDKRAAAKSAAQADYTARILSALQVKP